MVWSSFFLRMEMVPGVCVPGMPWVLLQGCCCGCGVLCQSLWCFKQEGSWVPCSLWSKMLLKYSVCSQWVREHWSWMHVCSWGDPWSYDHVGNLYLSLRCLETKLAWKALNCFWEPGYCSVSWKQPLLRGKSYTSVGCCMLQSKWLSQVLLAQVGNW